MADYKSMYFKLMAKVTDAIEILVNAQIEAEEVYIESGEESDEEESDNE